MLRAPGPALLEVVSFGNVGLNSLSSAFAGADNLDQLAALPASVANLDYAFNGADGLLAGVESWNTSGVTTMKGTFWGAVNFNRSVGSWDVSNVRSFQQMFSGATAFNQPLNDWDVTGALVTNARRLAFFQMFSGATSFNQPLDQWDVSGVEDTYYVHPTSGYRATDNFSYMFDGATSFAQSLTGWCVNRHQNLPTNFSTDSPMINEPLWGTCP